LLWCWWWCYGGRSHKHKRKAESITYNLYTPLFFHLHDWI
jgi:hypothetical protein